MPRVNRFIVLMLEDPCFEHLLGFVTAFAGETSGFESVDETPKTQGQAAAAIEANLEAAGL